MSEGDLTVVLGICAFMLAGNFAGFNACHFARATKFRMQTSLIYRAGFHGSSLFNAAQQLVNTFISQKQNTQEMHKIVVILAIAAVPSHGAAHMHLPKSPQSQVPVASGPNTARSWCPYQV